MQWIGCCLYYKVRGYEGLILGTFRKVLHSLNHRGHDLGYRAQPMMDGMLLGYHKDGNPKHFMTMTRRQLSPTRRPDSEKQGGPPPWENSRGRELRHEEA
jgi:hypothetical protein